MDFGSVLLLSPPQATRTVGRTNADNRGRIFTAITSSQNGKIEASHRVPQCGNARDETSIIWKECDRMMARRRNSIRSTCCGRTGGTTAAVGTIFDLGPVALPLLAPRERELAVRAG